MKIRNGFVSNSSSSSFIIGVAEVTDKAGLDQYCKEHNIKLNEDYDSPELKTGYEIAENKDVYSSIQVRGKELYVDAPVNSEPTVSTKFVLEKTYLIYCHGNDEGDSVFMSDDGYDLNYDNVDYDYFSEKEQSVIDIFSKNKFVKDAEYLFGAGRNG